MNGRQRRGSRQARACKPGVEILEDRRVLCAGAAAAVPASAPSAVTSSAPAVSAKSHGGADHVSTDSSSHPGLDLGSVVPGWTPQGIHGQDLAALIHQYQNDHRQGDPGSGKDPGDDSGDGRGSDNGPSTPATVSVAPSNPTPSFAPTPGGGTATTATTPPAASSTAVGGTAPDLGGNGNTPTPVALTLVSAAAADTAAVAVRNEAAATARAPATPPARVVVVAADETEPAGRVLVASAAPRVRLGNEHPAAAAAENAGPRLVAVDTLSGGGAAPDQQAALPGTNERPDAPTPDRDVPAPFDARPPAGAGQAVLDAGTAKPEAAPTPAPQEADVLAHLPPAAPPAAPRFLDRVGDWATALAGSRTFQVLFPVLMLALTGSTAYGVVRHRRRKRRPRPGQGAAPAADTATWLPGSAGSTPPERT